MWNWWHLNKVGGLYQCHFPSCETVLYVWRMSTLGETGWRIYRLYLYYFLQLCMDLQLSKRKKCLWWHSFAVEQRLNPLVWTSRPFHVLAPLSPAFCLLSYERCIFTVWTCVTRSRSRSRSLPGPWKLPSSSHPFTTLQRVIAIWFLFHVLVLPVFELHINEFMDFFFKLASFPQHSDYLCCK